MANQRHFVPTEVKTPKRVTAKIYLFDFFFLVAALALAFFTQNFIIPGLRIAYIAVVMIFAIYFTRRSSNNPGKRVFQSMWLFIRRPRTAYMPVENERFTIEPRKEK